MPSGQEWQPQQALKIMKDILKLNPSEYTPSELAAEMQEVLSEYEYDDEQEVIQVVIAGLRACL